MQLQHGYFLFSFYNFGKSVPIRVKLWLLLLGLGGNLSFPNLRNLVWLNFSSFYTKKLKTFDTKTFFRPNL